MRRLDEIKKVFVPKVHLDDSQATRKGLGEGEKRFAINRFPR
jgi:hypothetical protein